MRKLLSKLWADDGGFIISIELLFIAVILVIGLIAGWANLRVAIITQYTTLANAILSINFGYSIAEIEGDTGGSNGSQALQSIGLIETFGGPGPGTNVIGLKAEPASVIVNEINPGLIDDLIP